MPRPGSPCPTDERSATRRRSLVLAGAFAAWMVLIAGRLYYLQVIEYVHWLARAHGQQERTIELAPHRGVIFDSHMRPVAMSLPVDSVYAVPSHMADPAAAASLLAPILGLDARSLEARFDASRSFCWVKRKITAAQSARVSALGLKGIYFQKEMKRFYPMKDLAASVIGYVGMDDRGLGGLEQSLDQTIRGQPGHALIMEDARRQAFRFVDEGGHPGMNVELTLDMGLQYIAQRVLDADVAKWRAKGGVAVIQDSSNGDILAMASSPSFDPNQYAKTSPAKRIDRGVSWIYEPGSVFKLITISSAIQDGVAKATDVINTQMGSIELGGRVIHDDADDMRRERAGLNDMTVSQVFAYSSDVGSVKLALRLGENRFYRDICSFGIGQRTGIRLPGEERGLLMPPDRWSGVSIGEFAIGQGVGVTPVQLISAYSAIANGGTLNQARIVKAIFRGDDRQTLPPPWSRRIVTPHTAAIMRQMLGDVVAFGTGTNAQLDGYIAGGKTGTAQKVVNGRYSHTDFVASFVGVAPLAHPLLTILVSVDTPVGGHYGAEVAAPAEREIMQEALNYLNVPCDAPLRPDELRTAKYAFDPPAQSGPGADTVHPEARSVLDAAPSETPDPAAAQETIVNAGPLVSVPDFSGDDESEVAAECQSLGLGLTVTGSGLAVRQSSAAGTKIPGGSIIQVAFSR